MRMEVVGYQYKTCSIDFKIISSQRESQQLVGSLSCLEKISDSPPTLLPPEPNTQAGTHRRL